MPGKACQERKAERRKLKRKVEDGEGGLPNKLQAKDPDMDPAVVRFKVPEITELNDSDLEKRLDLLKCLAEAVREYDRGDGVAISLLANHYKVQAKKKDDAFAHLRLSDLVEFHSEIFQVVKGEEEQTADKRRSIVRLIESGVEEVLGKLEEVDESALPPQVDDPTDKNSALQAIRVEVVRSLSKRGGTCQLNDIGQEPHVHRHRSQWMKDVKLSDIAKTFPMNFGLVDEGNGAFMVELLSTDVDDVSMLSGFVSSTKSSKHADGGKGKGKGKGGKGKMQMMQMMQMMMGKGLNFDPWTGAPAWKGGGKGKWGKGKF